MSNLPFTSHPKLRWPIDLRIERQGEAEALIISCPFGIIPKPLVLVAAVAPVVVACDGTASFQQILDKFSPQGLSGELLEELLRILDQNYCLDTTRYQQAYSQLVQSYRTLPYRAPVLAGLAYPAEPEALGHLVDAYMHNHEALVVSAQTQLRVLVAPHIDYRRGGACYGATYPYLAASLADLYILIGTSHQYSRGLFHLSDKDFQSPLGTARCDKDFITSLVSSTRLDEAFAEEYLHRSEHSLELQLPFFTRLKPDALIVPLLVGSFHEMLRPHAAASVWHEYERFVEALDRQLHLVRSSGRTYTFVAGVDMAHVGRAFGDPEPLTPERLRDVSIRDSEYLAAIQEGDKEALFRHVSSDRDARRLCGFPTMYTVLDLLGRQGQKCAGTVIKYDQAVDYNTDCGVTFAGVVLSDCGVNASP
jgi:AmmeMemoRadiSam system protein B